MGTQARSLRVRVLLLAALSIVTALTVAWLQPGLHLRAAPGAAAGAGARHQARGAGAIVLRRRAGAPAVGGMLSDPRYDTPYGGAYWQVSDAAGAPVLRSRSLWDEVIPGTPAGREPEDGAVEREGPGARRSTSSSATCTARTAPDACLSAAGGGRPRRAGGAAAVLRARHGVAMGVLGALLLAGCVAPGGLRPAAAARAARAPQTPSMRARRRGCRDFPDEVAPLATDLNRLLDPQQSCDQGARARRRPRARPQDAADAACRPRRAGLEEAGMHAVAATLREQIGLMRRHIERELARAPHPRHAHRRRTAHRHRPDRRPAAAADEPHAPRRGPRLGERHSGRCALRDGRRRLRRGAPATCSTTPGNGPPRASWSALTRRRRAGRDRHGRRPRPAEGMAEQLQRRGERSHEDREGSASACRSSPTCWPPTTAR